MYKLDKMTGMIEDIEKYAEMTLLLLNQRNDYEKFLLTIAKTTSDDETRNLVLDKLSKR